MSVCLSVSQLGGRTFVQPGKSVVCRQLTDVINTSAAELGVKFFGTKIAQIRNHKRPQMENVISRETIALLQDHHFGAEQGRLDGRSQATRSRSDYQHLRNRSETSDKMDYKNADRNTKIQADRQRDRQANSHIGK